MDIQQTLFEMNKTLGELQQGVRGLDKGLEKVDVRLKEIETTLTNHRLKLAGWAGGASVFIAILTKVFT